MQSDHARHLAPSENIDGVVLDPSQLASLRELQLPMESDTLQVFADLFMSDAPPRLAALRAAVDVEDVPAILRGAHAVKAGAAGLGAERLRAACAALELCVFPSTQRQSSDLMDRIEAAYAATCVALQRELGSPSDSAG
jgi:HPt (histidine-containing phosphotransfer) domain-containing protein